MPVTIHDIAAELNVNASTVSRALNGNESISLETRNRIQQKAVELKYRPNKLASNLRKGKASSIGVIVPRIEINFFATVIQGMIEVLSEAGLNLLICQSGERVSDEIRSVHNLLDSRVDGIILSITQQTQSVDHIQEILDAGIHLIQFDRVIKDLGTTNVLNDNRGAAYDAVKHLIDQGYQDIVHFAGSQDLLLYRERFEGYQQALFEAGMGDGTVYFATTEVEGTEIAHQIFGNSSDKKPDAVFSSTDHAALAAMQVCSELSIAIPEEVGFVGFSNEPWTKLVTPSLTSVDQFSKQLGMISAKQMVAKIRGTDAHLSEDELLVKPKLIIRDSSLRKVNSLLQKRA